MIDVSGDVIYFENRPVGFVIIPNGTMRDRFEEALESAGDDSLEKELQEEKDARDEAEDKINDALKYMDESEAPSIQTIIEILS